MGWDFNIHVTYLSSSSRTPCYRGPRYNLNLPSYNHQGFQPIGVLQLWNSWTEWIGSADHVSFPTPSRPRGIAALPRLVAGAKMAAAAGRSGLLANEWPCSGENPLGSAV